MSSVVLFNTNGVIDRGSVEKLSLAMQTASSMTYMENDVNRTTTSALSVPTDEVLERPSLLWTVQNFHLKLVDKEGNSVSPATYIDNYLREVDVSNAGGSAFHQQFNRFFSGYDCALMPYPLDNMNNADELSSMASSELAARYNTAVATLRDQIRAKMRFKRVGKMILSGDDLADLMMTWTANMNVKIGSYQNSQVDLLRHVQSTKLAAVVKSYTDKMDENLALPLSLRALDEQHKASVALVMGELPLGDPDFLQAVLSELRERYTNTYVVRNRQALGPRYDEISAGQLLEFKKGVEALETAAAGQSVNATDLRALQQKIHQDWNNQLKALDLVEAIGGEFSRFAEDFDKKLSDALAPVLTLHLEKHAVEEARDKQFRECLRSVVPASASSDTELRNCTAGAPLTMEQQDVLDQFLSMSTALVSSANAAQECFKSVILGQSDTGKSVHTCVDNFNRSWDGAVASNPQLKNNGGKYHIQVKTARAHALGSAIISADSRLAADERSTIETLERCVQSIVLPHRDHEKHLQQCRDKSKSSFDALTARALADTHTKSVSDQRYTSAVERISEQYKAEEYKASVKACLLKLRDHHEHTVMAQSSLALMAVPQNPPPLPHSGPIKLPVLCIGSGIADHQIKTALLKSHLASFHRGTEIRIALMQPVVLCIYLYAIVVLGRTTGGCFWARSHTLRHKRFCMAAVAVVVFTVSPSSVIGPSWVLLLCAAFIGASAATCEIPPQKI